ncbi:hypothetical protein [Streptococcus sp. zg-JUN1979]|uniref:hypothetical protein n=1 Tax=Streptococcus sp. zg-JUN1979 TaxID=3391450 RepID=UPI0039A68BA8
MFDNAIVYDELGNVHDIDFDIIYQKYGYTSELANVEEIVKNDRENNGFENQVLFRSANPGRCAVVAIQDTLGVGAISALIGGGIVGLFIT